MVAFHSTKTSVIIKTVVIIYAATRGFLRPRESLNPWEKRADEGSARGLALIIISAKPPPNLSPTRVKSSHGRMNGGTSKKNFQPGKSSYE